jgi:hypothetical protein
MKYYSEARMGPVRKALEKAVLPWPGVEAREMMGCLVYFRGRRFFAFLVNGGLVLTKLDRAHREALASRGNTKAFSMAGRTASTWIQAAVAKPADVRPLLPYTRRSYEACGKG